MLLVTDQTYAEMRTAVPTTNVRWIVGYTDVSWDRPQTSTAVRCDSSR